MCVWGGGGGGLHQSVYKSQVRYCLHIHAPLCSPSVCISGQSHQTCPGVSSLEYLHTERLSDKSQIQVQPTQLTHVQVPSTNFEVFVYCFSGVDNDSRRSFCSKRCKKGRKMKTQYGSVYRKEHGLPAQSSASLGVPGLLRGHLPWQLRA